MAPTKLDLTWKSSSQQPTLPTCGYPHLAPAIYRNDPYSINFVLLDGEDPYIPTNELFAQIRRARLVANAVAGPPLAQFSITIGGIDGNEVTIGLTPAQTATLPNEAYWDIQEHDGDEPLVTWFTGRANAWGDVTREVTP